MERVLLSGLMKLELPGRTITLCDGGFVQWNGDLYQAKDDEFGILSGFNALTEGVGDEAPAGVLTMTPPSTTAATTLAAPGHQGSRLRLWVAELDERNGGVIGQPDQMVDWQVDSMRLRIGRGSRLLEIGCVTHGQRLMLRNEGNTLSPSFHRLIYPGEAGLDNATGLTTDVAWGAAAGPRGASARA
ncbi:hypothetical protein GCM10022253_24080 [Sphingomonas endophytica]|uniref:Uncharacterized protein n=1 Tax=Sphingomonas endophytica TaxID=869719 RepID=A0ABR6N2P6_9SPHN|nr:hypothetical protein [Sphingomonas endophytica]MBB5725056.1 hypothetical protein [Sphingomonas endophytica]